MIKATNKKITIGIGGVLIMTWLVYSLLFQQLYQDISFFATNDAPPLIRILEIIGYRGQVLLPYLTLFFALTSLSFLYCLYLFFLVRYRRGSYRLVIGVSSVFGLLILVNLVNKLAILLVVLVLVSLLVMYSLVATINYLYLDKTVYEAGDVLHTEGPFVLESQAQDYATTIIAKRQAEFKTNHLLLESDIYQDENSYYVDVYVENLAIDSK